MSHVLLDESCCTNERIHARQCENEFIVTIHAFQNEWIVEMKQWIVEMKQWIVECMCSVTLSQCMCSVTLSQCMHVTGLTRP